MEEVPQKSVIIVGAGLVGALHACFMAKRGFSVDLYEMRRDIRTKGVSVGRSINLALSRRGRDALKAVGLEEVVVSKGIPMYARMIHGKDGARRPIPYGTKDQYIMSVDRQKLNELLLTAAEENPKVRLHFEHKLLNCDFENKEVSLQTSSGEIITKRADLIVGCDGAYSAVRRHVMKSTRFDFSQEYIPHGYLELTIPPNQENEYAMETNYLHIWPRNEFMMIALPDTGVQRFVVTLFMPFDIYQSIKTTDDLDKFFEENFADSIPLLGREELHKTFFQSKPSPLISIKCQPYHHTDSCVMLGDAIHAMVPFYGQGMNCGFEDCLVFDNLMTKFDNDIGKVLQEFSTTRNDDAKAMCDLAMYNYIEMRKSVNSRLFLLRKSLDNFLHWMLPTKWVPLYTSVSFTRIPYSQCIKNRAWQDVTLQRLISMAGVATVGVGLYFSLQNKTINSVVGSSVASVLSLW